MSSALDPAVFALARDGDVDALTALLAWSRPRLQRYAQRSCTISDVDDAVQEALLSLSRSVSVLRHARAVSTWLFRVVRRHCHRLGRLALRVDLWDDDRLDAVVGRWPDEVLRLSLARALESLPAHHREVVLLRDVQELTIEEIAAQLGESTAAVKSRLHRARELAREYLLS